ncbi:MAG: type IV toxin-antitoxin system AbiEi family antitoxin domain-containing protein [Vulcanimicrobiota bacterium]
MTKFKRNKLNDLFKSLPDGVPVTSGDLATLDISASLAVQYVRAGWLTRLSRGVFSRPGPLDLHACLRFLEGRMEGLHVGGKTALDWYGIRHNLAHRRVLRLYGWASGPLPAWFTENFPESSYHRLRLFDESPTALLHVLPYQNREEAPLVSTPERATLELLSEVGVRQPLQEAQDILESAPHLRASVLQELLERCRQVKTVRLCLTIGSDLGLPWASKLDAKRLPKGRGRWVGQTKEGFLIL